MARLAVVVIAALAAAALALPAAAPAAPAAPTAAAAATTTVQLEDSIFAPATLSLRRGARLRFVWAGTFAHNLTGRGVPRSYATPRVRARTLTLTLRRAGTFKYLCTLHSGMALRVRVR
ncbi:unannotated protein [freshwater metagenome]|uniref:Unannotated protein n=1 Tax=freshwater metagenome TaxID=449393 RepID=A0A6J7JGG8_9ZZZZ